MFKFQYKSTGTGMARVHTRWEESFNVTVVDRFASRGKGGGGGGGGGGGNRCPPPPPPLHALPSILPWLLLLSDHSAHPSSYLQGGLNSIKTCWRSSTGDAKAQSTLELFKQ